MRSYIMAIGFLLMAAGGPALAQAGGAKEAQAFADASVIAESDLGALTGQADIGTMLATATQRNTVSNNSVSGNSVTGAVQIDGNAFQNLQGLAVISANSGNNVAINSAMSVTINMAPPR